MGKTTTAKSKAKAEQVDEGPELNGDGTVKRDAGDVGVPMLPGDPAERQGPEDALGEGPKRGDYRDRVNPLAHQGSTPQAPNAEDIGDEAGAKGGVDTVPPVEPAEPVEPPPFVEN